MIYRMVGPVTRASNVAARFHTRFSLGRASIWEIAVMIGLAHYMAPLTVFTSLLNDSANTWLDELGLIDPEGDFSQETLSYGVAYVLLLALLVKYFCVRSKRLEVSAHLTGFLDLMAVLGLIYLADLFTSTRQPFLFRWSAWPLFSLSSFFVCVLFLDLVSCIRVTKFVILAIAAQSIYAVLVHVSDLYRSSLSVLGSPASGSFVYPVTLYLLCMLGLPLSYALGRTQSSAWGRCWFQGATACIVLALVCTYSLSAWLAVMVGLLHVARYTWEQHREGPQLRSLSAVHLTAWLLIAVAIVLPRVRAYSMVDVPEAPWRRTVAIDQAALRTVVQQPWLGTGLNTYEVKLKKYLPPDQKAGEPSRERRGNLYLNLAVELGLVGLTLFALLSWRYKQVYNRIWHSPVLSREAKAVAVGVHGGMIAFAVGGLLDIPVLHFNSRPSTLAVAVLLGVVCILANRADALAGRQISVEVTRGRHFCWWTGAGIVLVVGASVWLLAPSVILARFAIHRVAHHLSKDWRTVAVSRRTGSDGATGLRDAVVAIQDQCFYSHCGIDWRRLHETIRARIRSRPVAEGAETITMTAARLALGSDADTVARRIAQFLLAFNMEIQLSKAQILEVYLNSANYGLKARGVQTAARVYFGKELGDLTLAEGSFLASLLASPPSCVNEITQEFAQRHRDLALERLGHQWPFNYTLEERQRARANRLVFAWQRTALGGRRSPEAVGSATACR
jgi:hypothetical protein